MAEGQMNAKLVERIRKILELAERGEVVSVAIATVGPDLATGSSFLLGDATLAELLGSVALMNHRIMAAAEKGELD